MHFFFFFNLQLALEQHRFELHWFIYTRNFFFPRQMWVENTVHRGLTFHVPTVGLKYAQILVSMGSPGTNPPHTPKDDCVW